ncbi:MAG: leucine-rich repeat domain-containing protein, partial [archaeon]|nr:leucine-rich repeat domain-containing protein [archaeon]
MADNDFHDVPIEIAELEHLVFLDLSGNQLSEFPEECCEALAELKNLFLQNNHLTTLPESFAKLEELRILRLSNNRLKEVPECIIQLVSLEELYLEDNAITSSTPEFQDLCEVISVVALDGNPLVEEPPELTPEAVESLMAMLREGGIFMRHGSKGVPVVRNVFVSQSFDQIISQDPRKKGRTQTVEVSRIKEIISGRQTPVLLRSGTHERERNYFSIIYGSKKDHSLDLEANELAEASEWFIALRTLLELHRVREAQAGSSGPASGSGIRKSKKRLSLASASKKSRRRTLSRPESPAGAPLSSSTGSSSPLTTSTTGSSLSASPALSTDSLPPAQLPTSLAPAVNRDKGDLEWFGITKLESAADKDDDSEDDQYDTSDEDDDADESTLLTTPTKESKSVSEVLSLSRSFNLSPSVASSDSPPPAASPSPSPSPSKSHKKHSKKRHETKKDVGKKDGSKKKS